MSKTDRSQRCRHQIADLALHFNNDGVSYIQKRSDGDLDGFGTTFCAKGLPESQSMITCNGVEFLFPDKSDGANNNIACVGQDLPLPSGCYQAIHILGMSDWRAFEETLILRYLNESCTETSLGLSDASHYHGLLYGEREAIRCTLVTPDSLIPHIYLFGIHMPGEDYQMQEMTLDAGIWHQVIPVDATKALSRLKLPDNPNMHIFALTLTMADDKP